MDPSKEKHKSKAKTSDMKFWELMKGKRNGLELLMDGTRTLKKIWELKLKGRHGRTQKTMDQPSTAQHQEKRQRGWRERRKKTPWEDTTEWKFHGYTVHQTMLKTFSLPTDAHNVKKHRVIKTF